MTQLKKNLIRVLAALAAVALCLTGAVTTGVFEGRTAAAEEQEIVGSYPYTTVTRVKVNLRKGRSTRTTLIQRIPEGAEISVLSKNGSWVEVQYGKYKGWVLGEYIVLKTVKKIRVTPTPTPIPTLSPQEDAGGYQILKRGATGVYVRSLQEALIELGFLTGDADGNFGAATEQAVIAFQRKNQYPDTGLVDANLQAFLYSGKPVNAKGTATAIKTLSPVPGVTMKLNNTGALVGELQQKLSELGFYTGKITNKYDTATKNAVLAFQKKNGIKADGWAGAETRNLIETGGLAKDQEPTPTPSPEPTPTEVPVYDTPDTTVRSGSTGEDAGTVQARLKLLGYYRGEVDGNFGRASVNALKSFQTNNGLKADGVAGKDTYAKLFDASAIPFAVAETPTAAPPMIPTAAPATAAPAVSVWATLREGMKGTEVKQLQENLIQLGYLTGRADGSFGVLTAAAVKAFQKNNGLTADGAAGEKTLKLLYGGSAKAAPATATPKPGTAETPAPSTLRRGSTGTAVKDLQTRLIELGYLGGRADGVYGSKTAQAVKAFQKDNRLTADGVAGTKTLKQLLTAAGKTTAAATATPAPATPAPTAVPGGQAALSGRPSASRVIYANWYTTVKAICKKYPYATIYDYNTGISWQIHMFSLGAHADFEPVTANDTARMVRAFGNETTWNPKPVWVIFSDGSVYMASTHDTPHGVSHNSDNNFAGHACLHFPRTQEQVTSIGPYATSHQEAIDQGWAATRKLVN